MDFRERLVILRKEHKETQAQLAKNIGRACRSLQQLEAGDNYPQYKTLIALADHFDVSLDYLTGRTDRR